MNWFFYLILVLWSTGANCVFKLQIIHNNDMHAHFEQTDTYQGTCPDSYIKDNKCFGGFARVKQAADDARREAQARGLPSIFLNAGDTFQGTPYYTLYKWKIVAPLIQMLDFDVMTLGNHEFDDGIDNLVQFLTHVKTPTVVCNFNLTTEPRLNLPILTPSTTLTVNNTKVGIIGYLTPDTTAMSKTENLQIFDEIPYIQAEARLLKKAGVNIIIALGHAGFEVDKKIAAAIPEISMIVGGHSHSLLYSPKDKPPSTEQVVESYPYFVTQTSGKKIPIVQSFCNTKYLGKITVTFDDNGDVITAEGNSFLLDWQVKQDEAVQQQVADWSTLVKQRLATVKGYTRVFLRLSREDTAVGQYESNLANLITDSMVDFGVKLSESHNTKEWTDAPIAIVQAGGIRGQIDHKKNKGAITVEDILTLLPFDEPVCQVQYKGSTIKTALEKAVYEEDVRAGFQFYLYSSGMKIVYDLSKPSGHRVKSVMTRCKFCSIPRYEPLNPDQVYSLITVNFLANGGDKFDIFVTERLNITIIDKSPANILTEYLEKNHIVYPALEGRIVAEGLDAISSARKISISMFTFLIVPIVIHTV